MPVAKIHVHGGAFDDNELSTIGLAVRAALEEVLSLLPRHARAPKGAVRAHARFRRLHVQRTARLPRTDLHLGSHEGETLGAARCVNRLVVERVGLQPDDLLIVIYELPGENISFGKGLAQRANIAAAAQ
jgi:hypothetical protein